MKKILLASAVCLWSITTFAQTPLYYKKEVYYHKEKPATITTTTPYSAPVHGQKIIPTPKSTPIKAEKTAFIRPYVSIKGMGSFWNGKMEYKEPSDEYDSGTKESIDASKFNMGAALALGVKMPYFRTELEVSGFGSTDKEKIFHELDISVNEEGDVEGYYAYQTEGELKSKGNVLINLYYDIETKTAFTPYIGIGAGISRLKGKSYSVEADRYGINSYYYKGSDSKTKTNFAWQVGVGTSVALTPNFSLDAGYRYFNGGKVSLTSGYEGIITSKTTLKNQIHQVYFGLRYTF